MRKRQAEEVAHAQKYRRACADQTLGWHACPPSPSWLQQQQGIESSPLPTRHGLKTAEAYLTHIFFSERYDWRKRIPEVVEKTADWFQQIIYKRRRI